MEKRKNKTRLARAAMTLLVMLCFLGGARAQQALPYEYGFENNDLAADGWTTLNESTNNAGEFGITTDAKHNGTYGFRFSSFSRDNVSYDQYLISPELNATSGVLFQFYYKASSSYGTETFKVGYSTTDAEITSFTFGDEITTNSTTWTQSEEYVFPAGTKYVAIYYYSDYQYRLYVDDFTFVVAPSCVKPTGLAVTTSITTDAKTATATWEGTASLYNIDINGTVIEDVTSPYEFDVELSTEYTVKVQANCGGGDFSDWSSPFSFTTPDCIGGHVIEYTLNDSYGDGWSGNAINVVEGCGNVIATLTIENGNKNSGTLSLCSDYYEFVWVKGSYPGETSWTFTEGGITLFSGSGTNNMATGDMLYTIGTSTKPTGLAAGTPGTHEVALTWTPGNSETAWQICLNNDESNIININNANSTINEGTVSYTLTGLTADTEYSVMVRAFIDNDTQSCWSAPVTFTTAPTCPKPTNLVAGSIDTHSAVLSWTEKGEADQWQICINGDESNLIAVNENPFTLTNLDPETAYSVKVRAYCSAEDQSSWSDAVTFTTAEACPKPTNLAETNITTNSATLSWEGYNDSYVLQYRPWNPAGDDIITTGTLTTYTVDLSQYEGTGSVAIRHYDISDMFQLIVDNIEVTNAAGTVVYSQDFEDCGGNMPAEFSNMDLDGDGYMWEIASSPSSNVDGSYGIVSASYDNYAGALTPDNWLIVSGIEMGGQMTFQARGQDPAYAAENFAIYVSTENSIVEVPVTATTYNATDLTPNTPYAWQVKGVCSEVNESRFVSSFFKTKDDMLVFATDGNWNDVANWKDAEGNTATVLPTNVNNVRIDAAAVIPAGYVACANKATIGTGSITIKDGGQLKQNAATLRVTMEKEIAGYGENDGNYYFIASPFNGRTLYSESGSFSIVNNMLTDEYDLNAFDAAASDGLEWINYKSESQTHNAFIAENELAGLLYSEGYLYANQEGTILEFIGTTGKSNNYSGSRDFTYDDSSSDVFNGWKLIGNPFTCNGYITYSGDATFYKMNGDGLEAFENGVVLAPGEGAFIKVSASGTITFSSEAPEGFTSTSTTAAGILPLLPLHGLTTNVDANGEDILFAKEGYATYYNGKYDVVLPAGMKAHVVTDGSTNLTYAGVADGDTDGNVVPKGTAVLLQVEPSTKAQTLPVYLATPSAAAYADTNLLFGSDEATETTGGAKYYKLTYSNSDDNFGWYWGAANGAAFTSPAHKAWLALPASSSAPFLGLPGWEDTTGIAPVGVDSESGEWYTLQGLKIGKKPTTKGVYIHNGRKVVIK